VNSEADFAYEGSMKRILSIVLMPMLFSAFTLADAAQPSITYVKRARSHQKTQHHHAHKATKHHMPKRSRRTV
jgi:hypothetical protein